MSVHSTEIVLLSGGLDSTALASIRRPALTLFVDYGQRPAPGERRAAAMVAKTLRLEHHEVRIDLSAIGGGLLQGEEPLEGAPSPEWWPFRNQFLGTIGAAVAVQRGLSSVSLGSVLGDGDRHADGTPGFYEALTSVTEMQEGGIAVAAPALTESTEDLVRRSGLGMDVLGWTISCHRAELPCRACPGCFKREKMLTSLGFVSDHSHRDG